MVLIGYLLFGTWTFIMASAILVVLMQPKTITGLLFILLTSLGLAAVFPVTITLGYIYMKRIMKKVNDLDVAVKEYT